MIRTSSPRRAGRALTALLAASSVGLVPAIVRAPTRTFTVDRLVIAGAFLLGGYVSMIVAMRNGEVSVATPFRYSGMLAALFAGWLIWNEVPDTLSLIGIAIVCAAGLYTLHRERLRGHDPIA